MRWTHTRLLPAIVATAAFLAATTTAAPADSNPMFVVGDTSAVTNSSVTFWGAQWWKDNLVSGGAAPASFKGWAVTVTPSADNPCAGTFTTEPGNSSDPPATLPSGPLDVLVANSITKLGSEISGTYTDIIMVQPDPGYQGNPGHPGTGVNLGEDTTICNAGGAPG